MIYAMLLKRNFRGASQNNCGLSKAALSEKCKVKTELLFHLFTSTGINERVATASRNELVAIDIHALKTEEQKGIDKGMQANGNNNLIDSRIFEAFFCCYFLI